MASLGGFVGLGGFRCSGRLTPQFDILRLITRGLVRSRRRPSRSATISSRPVNSGPRPCLIDVGFPLSGLQVRIHTSDLNVRARAHPSRRSRSPLTVAASASTARRCMSSRRNARAAVRPTRTRSTAASTRRRTQLATRRGGRRDRWCSPKRTPYRCFLLHYYPDIPRPLPVLLLPEGRVGTSWSCRPSVTGLGVGGELVPECAVVLRGDLGCGHGLGVAGRL